MDANRLANPEKASGSRRCAWFRLDDGAVFEVRMSSGCECFIGHFTRLSDLRHTDNIIRFGDPALARPDRF